MEPENANPELDPSEPLPLANLTDGRITVGGGSREGPAPDPGRTRPILLPPEPGPLPPSPPPVHPHPFAPPPRPVPMCCWVALGSSLTSVVLAVLLWIQTRPPLPAGAAPATRSAPARPAAVPAALKPYLDAAEQGDVNAMRMLGAMYYHGLNLPRNREAGLAWYRKAAAAGSHTAQEELRQME